MVTLESGFFLRKDNECACRGWVLRPVSAVFPHIHQPVPEILESPPTLGTAPVDQSPWVTTCSAVWAGPSFMENFHRSMRIHGKFPQFLHLLLSSRTHRHPGGQLVAQLFCSPDGCRHFGCLRMMRLVVRILLSALSAQHVIIVVLRPQILHVCVTTR